MTIQLQLQSQFGVQAVQSALMGTDTDLFSSVIVAEWALGVAGLPGLMDASNQALGEVHSALNSPEFIETCTGIMSRYAQGVGGPVHIEKALALIRQSRGQSLPAEVEARLSQALGSDISSARIHTDGAAGQAAKIVNARAFAMGRDIFFAPNQFKPGTRTGDELLLHELIHVIQDAEGRLPSPTSSEGVDVSSPSDTHEREAVREASSAVKRLYSSEPAGSESQTDGIDRVPEDGIESTTAAAGDTDGTQLQRAVENPSLPTDADSEDDWDTRLEPVRVDEGYASKGSKLPQASVSGTVKKVDMEVRLLRTRTDPLKGAMSGISDDDLFDVLDGAGEEQCTGRGLPVVEQHGTGADPNVEVKPTSDALYIGGAPSSEDVSQGQIGDCYFFSALLTILNQDPERVSERISLDGDNVKFNFWTTADEGLSWTTTSVTTDRTTIQWAQLSDPSADHEVYGAGVRVGSSPVDAEHFADVTEDKLKIYRVDIYEMAMWVTLMEKAYAVISEKTNQYGGYATGEDVNGAGPGYDQIDGGYESWVYGLFYGPDLIDSRSISVEFVAGEDVVQLNAGAVKSLLQLQGYRAGEGDKVDADEHVMVNASTGCMTAIARLLETIAHCFGLDDMAHYPSLREVLEQIECLAAAHQATVDNGEPDEVQAAALNQLAVGCDRQVQTGAWPMLEDPQSDKIWSDLHESLAIVGQAGTDSSDGTRNIYAGHAYAVLAAQFLDHEGSPMSLNIDNLDTEIANISGIMSKVELRNPHHTNEPNLPSSMVDSDVNDGVFSMTLDAYLRAFSANEIAQVHDT